MVSICNDGFFLNCLSHVCARFRLALLFFAFAISMNSMNLGDASSPHGSNCLQFHSNGVGGDGSKSSSPSLPAANSNEGLSRQQLDLISQIMNQTKPNVSLTANQPNGQKSIPRPRTWNIQVRKSNEKYEKKKEKTSCQEMKSREGISLETSFTNCYTIKVLDSSVST